MNYLNEDLKNPKYIFHGSENLINHFFNIKSYNRLTKTLVFSTILTGTLNLSHPKRTLGSLLKNMKGKII